MADLPDPHAGVEWVAQGTALDEAPAAAILLHGRGGSAEDVLGLARALGQPRLAFLAPQAIGRTWYPESFLAPVERNEPWLSSALAVVHRLLETIAGAGIPAERAILIGFSQGGCLALEFAARNPARYGGVSGLAAGLIGAPGIPRDYPGSLRETPVFLGCGDRDPFVPMDRFEETAAAMTRLGAALTSRIYPGMGHIVNEDEVGHLRRMAASLLASTPGDRPGKEPR